MSLRALNVLLNTTGVLTLKYVCGILNVRTTQLFSSATITIEYYMSLQEDITSVRKDIEAATERLKKLEEQAKQAEVWQPKVGEWTALPGKVVRNIHLDSDTVRRAGNAGRLYQNETQAIAAQKRIDFYARLVALATELNPSGIVGGTCGIQWDVNRQRLTIIHNEEVIGLFQSSDVAYKAITVINKERWFDKL